MIQWAKFASRAKSIGSKAKGAAKKLKSKMTPTPESVLGARAKMQVGYKKRMLIKHLNLLRKT